MNPELHLQDLSYARQPFFLNLLTKTPVKSSKEPLFVPLEVCIEILKKIDFNENFKTYKNCNLVCKKWNIYLSNDEVVQTINSLSCAEELLGTHPAIHRLFWKAFDDKVVNICVEAVTSSSMAVVLNKVNHWWGYSWNYTKEQMVAFNKRAEREFYRECNPYAQRCHYIPRSDKWFNQDSYLAKFISVGLKVYTLYKFSSIFHKIYSSYNELSNHHELNKDKIIKSSIFKLYAEYCESYCHDEVLKNYTCPISKKVIIMPVYGRQNVDSINQLVDYLSVANTDFVAESFDLPTFKKIQARISYLRSMEEHPDSLALIDSISG